MLFGHTGLKTMDVGPQTRVGPVPSDTGPASFKYTMHKKLQEAEKTDGCLTVQPTVIL